MQHTAHLSTAAAGTREDPQWHGLYDAQIAVTTDPLNQGRVRLRIPQILGNTLSNWAPPMQPGIATPAVGTSVFAMFLGGNPNIPYYFFGVTPNFTQAIAPNNGLVLNQNPFFIGNVITPWTATNGTLTAVQPNPSTNPPFIFGVLLTASGGGGCTLTEAGSPFQAAGSQPYQFSAWVFYPAGGLVSVGFSWKDPAGNTLAPATQVFNVAPDTWTQLQTVQNSPVNTATGWPTIGPVTSVTGQLFIVEAAQVIGQIPGALIQPASLTSTQIAPGSIQNTITAANITANTITAAQIAANTITAGQIAANTITAAQIAAFAIQSALISAGAIDGHIINQFGDKLGEGILSYTPLKPRPSWRDPLPCYRRAQPRR